MPKKGMIGKLALAIASVTSTGCLPFANAIISDFNDINAKTQETVKNYKPKKQMRIMTYNIAHGRGVRKDSKFRGMGHSMHELGINSRMTEHNMYMNLDGIASAIRKLKPDIVLLNEADFRAKWSFDVDQVKYLAENTGMKHYAYGTKWDLISLPIHFHCGNAILSKYPIITGKNERFREPGLGGWLAGSYSYMDIIIDVGRKINILHSHLDGSIEERNHQASVISELAEGRVGTGMPVIITGDLNALPPAANEHKKKRVLETILESNNFYLYPKLEEKLESEEYNDMGTSSEGNTIDHIIVSKDFRYEKCFVPKLVYSDHMPMVCDVYLDD